MAEQWMSIVEYARSFSVSDMTVRRRIKSGKLHAVLKDGKYFIPVMGMSSNQVQADPSPGDGFGGNQIEPPSSPRLPNAVSPKSFAHADRMMAGASRRTEPSFDFDGSDREDGHLKWGSEKIPASISDALNPNKESMVATSQLLNFCEKSLIRINSIERHINDTYRYKLELLEQKLKNKDLEINRMRQQIEDLQTLLNMIDHSKD